jgi:phosphoribosyl-AMP cyclohydrolase
LAKTTGADNSSAIVTEPLIWRVSAWQGWALQPAAGLPEAIGDGWIRSEDIGYPDEDGYLLQCVPALDRGCAETSLRERTAVLWSTSRNELWRRGATSGDVLELAEIQVNCEQNSLLYLVRRTTGGACHTVAQSGSSRPSCYYRAITEGMTLQHRAP